MKTILIFILTITLGVSAQEYVNEDTVNVYSENTLNPATKSIRIPVNFNESKLLSEIPDEIEDLTIEKVELVYTTFKESQDFDQIGLNQNRMKTFKNAFSNLDSPLIQWNIIGQSSARTAEAAKEYFHGFVVYYRPKPTKESIEHEISFMDSLLGEPFDTHFKVRDVETSTTKYEDRSSTFIASYDTPILMPLSEKEKNVDEDCIAAFSGTMNVKPAVFKHFQDSILSLYNCKRIQFTTEGELKENEKSTYNFEYYLIKEDCYDVKYITASSEAEPFYASSWIQNADYNVVQEAFERNPQWENSLVIIDVTGSMSPYIGKTMSWVKATQDSSQISAFVFFNDGDATPHNKKVTGRVGGIYSVINESFSSVYSEMKSTMRKGGGGDCPENNVEATIKGTDEFPECDEIIMVADNWATPRDMKFTSQLKKPVHVILCGGSMGINEAYIQLAYDTKGSVHTIEEDLNMREIKPGKQFKVGSSYFTLVNGRIVRAKHK